VQPHNNSAEFAVNEDLNKQDCADLQFFEQEQSRTPEVQPHNNSAEFAVNEDLNKQDCADLQFFEQEQSRTPEVQSYDSLEIKNCFDKMQDNKMMSKDNQCDDCQFLKNTD